MVNVAPIVGFHVSKIAIFQKLIYLTKQIWPLISLIINCYYYLYANLAQASTPACTLVCKARDA